MMKDVENKVRELPMHVESSFRFVREEKQFDGRVVSPAFSKILLNEKRMKKK